ncbi:N-acetylmuramoyl-L-alanine amidase [Haoranjiania flava]|uniref:N-acetylmuramoyl-L-alanine amidase n=1 Tax=Haoranjiania flava TaxID=1856322 RepID=A0AAE3IJX2_9BACT|nr:N-acetylmuramoyl-L-alanine amidase [Haoranjiania flava]MCU7693415.1 N-acetylmuramoyl-L-alanine amidase [Haoranjiania flava]
MQLKFSIQILCLTLLLAQNASWKVYAHDDKRNSKNKAGIKTIIVDAGHGMPDPGAQGSFSNEADINLGIAMKLGEKLKKALPDCKILYTRTSRNLPNGLQNKDAANRWRAQFANDNKGDLYISIHVNDVAARYGRRVIGTREENYTTYTGKGKKRKKITGTRTVNVYESYRLPCATRGTQTYVWSAAKNDEKKGYINQEMSREYDMDTTFSMDEQEAKILASIYLKKYMNRSRALAELVEEEFRAKGLPSAGGAMQFNRGIKVLGATAMPSILVETGYICNPADEQYLNSTSGQDTIADAIMNAVVIYKKNVEAGIITEGLQGAD